jgi:hypothetical protein
MGQNRPPYPMLNFPFDSFKRADGNILNPATGKTDEMMMVVEVRAEMIIKLTVWMNYLGNYTPGRQFLKVSVDGRQPDPAELPLHFQPYFIRADVSHLFPQYIQYRQSFWGGFHFYGFKCLCMLATHFLQT